MRSRLAPAVLIIAALTLTGCAAKTPVRVETPSAAAEASVTVTVPDVTGQDGSAAKKALKALGLIVEFDAGSDETVLMASNWTVDSQTPAPGESAGEGSTVTLIVSKPEAPVSDLAERTHAEYLNAWGVGDLIDLAGAEGVNTPYYAIATWENVNASTIRVYVQEAITKDVATHIGENILGLTGQAITDLDSVVIQGTDGIDINTHRFNVPLLNQ